MVIKLGDMKAANSRQTCSLQDVPSLDALRHLGCTLEDPCTHNLYLYVQNDPLTHVDPSGNIARSIFNSRLISSRVRNCFTCNNGRFRSALNFRRAVCISCRRSLSSATKASCRTCNTGRNLIPGGRACHVCARVRFGPPAPTAAQRGAQAALRIVNTIRNATGGGSGGNNNQNSGGGNSNTADRTGTARNKDTSKRSSDVPPQENNGTPMPWWGSVRKDSVDLIAITRLPNADVIWNQDEQFAVGTGPADAVSWAAGQSSGNKIRVTLSITRNVTSGTLIISMSTSLRPLAGTGITYRWPMPLTFRGSYQRSGESHTTFFGSGSITMPINYIGIPGTGGPGRTWFRPMTTKVSGDVSLSVTLSGFSESTTRTLQVTPTRYR